MEINTITIVKDTKVFFYVRFSRKDGLPRSYIKASLIKSAHEIVQTSENRLLISAYQGREPRIYENLDIADIFCVFC